MEFGVAQSRGGAMVAARAAKDRMCLLTVAHAGASRPAAALEGSPSWQAVKPENLRTFSAAC
jgi:hypothetical protein